MSEIRRIRDQLSAAFDGSPWHGPSLWDLLADVKALEAQSHPVRDVHSVLELVLHMTYWRRVVLEALAGTSIAAHQPNTPEDWRSPEGPDNDAWREALEALRRSQDELLAALDGLGESALEQRVPGRDYNVDVLLYGILQHDVYHMGQIAILRKAYTTQGVNPGWSTVRRSNSGRSPHRSRAAARSPRRTSRYRSPCSSRTCRRPLSRSTGRRPERRSRSLQRRPYR